MKRRETKLRLVVDDHVRIADPPIVVRQVYDFFIAVELDPRKKLLGTDFLLEAWERSRYILTLVAIAHGKVLPGEADRNWELTKEAQELFTQLQKWAKDELEKQR
jgi:hypothetical protein